MTPLIDGDRGRDREELLQEDRLSWSEFSCKEVFQEYKEIQRLIAIVDPENEPFRSKYEAMERLEALQGRARQYAELSIAGEEAGKDAARVLSPWERMSEIEVQEAKDMVALCDQKRGALALDTEQNGLAERLLLAAIARLQMNEGLHAELIQDSYNLLGVIWCNRNEHLKAEEYLLQAEKIHKRYALGRSVSSYVANRGALLPFYVDCLDSIPIPIPNPAVSSPPSSDGKVGPTESLMNNPNRPDMATAEFHGFDSDRKDDEHCCGSGEVSVDLLPSATRSETMIATDGGEAASDILRSHTAVNSYGRGAEDPEGMPCGAIPPDDVSVSCDFARDMEGIAANEGRKGPDICDGVESDRAAVETAAAAAAAAAAGENFGDGTVAVETTEVAMGNGGQKLKPQKMESLYTLTAFYLAQVYGNLGNYAKSAAYIAMTLNRQLESGESFSCLEWVDNCTRLAGFYIQEADFKNAAYCLSAAKAVLIDSEDKTSERAITAEANLMLGWARLYMRCLEVSRNRALEEEEEEKESSSKGLVAADAESNVRSRCQISDVSDTTSAESVGTRQMKPDVNGTEEMEECLTKEMKDMKLQIGEAADTTDRSQVELKGEEVEGGSTLSNCDGIDKSSSTDVVDEQKAVIVTPNFDKLKLPLSSLGDEFPDKAQVLSYQDAVEQFNKSMKYFKRALEYYVLDGFVTDHFSILMDVSSLHKYLSYFEKDVKRCSQIHKRRAIRLEPLVDELNPDAYPLLWEELNYELGAIYREVAELLSDGGVSSKKVAAAAFQAAGYYERVVDVFDPARVKDDHPTRNLMVAFSLARIYQKLHQCAKDVPSIMEKAGEPVGYLKKSLQLYQFIVDYGSKHPVQGMEERIALCKEMAEVLPPFIEEHMEIHKRRK